MQCDRRAQDGGVIWRRRVIDDRLGKINMMIHLGDEFEEDSGSDFRSVCNDLR
jgi:hypothetical protein